MPRPRPQTHDLAQMIFNAFDIQLERVELRWDSGLNNRVLAGIFLGDLTSIIWQDPGQAIMLGFRSHAPIWVDQQTVIRLAHILNERGELVSVNISDEVKRFNRLIGEINSED